MENNKRPEFKGEVSEIIKNLEKETTSMMSYLQDIDDKLIEIHDEIKESETLDRENLMKTIVKIREMIGTLENQDKAESAQEEAADNLIKRFKQLIDKVV